MNIEVINVATPQFSRVPRRIFASQPIRDRRKAPANPSPVLRSLERKYQETLGAKKKLQESEYEWQGFNGFEEAEHAYLQRLAQLDSTLAALEQSIREFDPDWQRKRLMEPKLLRATRALPKGSYSSALPKVMHAAEKPLTVKEISERIARELDLPMVTRDQRQKAYAATYNSLRRSLEKGYVECLDCQPAQWVSAAPTSR